MLNKLKTAAGSKPEHSKNWYKDRFEQVRFMRDVLAILTVVCLLICLVVALIGWRFAPLKSVDPFVIQVDDKTGYTQVVNPLTVKEITGDRAINTYFVVKYLRARENYDIITREDQYNTVRVMSAPQTVFREYLQENNLNNPNSRAARLQSVGTRSIKIKSVVFTEAHQATIRFSAEERYTNSDAKTFHYIAYIVFNYNTIDMREEERYINPLGFWVTRYRVDEDNVEQ